MNAPTCASCRTAMEPGFVPEAVPGGIFVSVWHPGDPTKVKKTWAERIASPGGVRYGREEVLAIEAYRCAECGRLELFARERPEAGEGL